MVDSNEHASITVWLPITDKEWHFTIFEYIYIYFFCVTRYSKDLDLQDIEGETCILQKEAKK